MPLDDDELRRLVLDLLKTPTTRTKQRKIGASSIGDPCAFCLANQLLAHSQKQSQYWLGARIGDAIHKLLESEAEKHITTAQEPKFKALEGADIEKSVYIGTLDNYGDIWSTPDLYIASEEHLVDYKTSKRSKVELYRLDPANLPEKYIYQVMLYGRALIAAGKPVKRVSFVFINRDGTSDRDVIVISFDYDQLLADMAWDRLVDAWEWLEDGGDPDTLPSDPNCWYCNSVIHRM